MRFQASRRRRGGRWRWLVILVGGLIAAVAIMGVLGALQGRQRAPMAIPSAPTVVADAAQRQRPPLVFTYFYYWYDATTGAHLGPNDPLPTRPPPHPPASWRSEAWFRKELADMAYAGIDVVLPVYWGTGEAWSTDGLTVLARARAQMLAEGQPAPAVGIFFDTAALAGRNLLVPADRDFFYTELREAFRRLPPEHWALIDGRPVLWLFTSDFVEGFDQQIFDEIYTRFESDFGVRPYIVREVSWNFEGRNRAGVRRTYDSSKPLATEANYVWGAAQNGYPENGSVAAVGPGYDERQIKGRAGVYRPRDEGRWYIDNFHKAIASGKRMLVIETWNELHEASGISETVEYGRRYLDLTRELVAEYKRSLAHAGP